MSTLLLGIVSKNVSSFVCILVSMKITIFMFKLVCNIVSLWGLLVSLYCWSSSVCHGPCSMIALLPHRIYLTRYFSICELDNVSFNLCRLVNCVKLKSSITSVNFSRFPPTQTLITENNLINWFSFCHEIGTQCRHCGRNSAQEECFKTNQCFKKEYWNREDT